MNRNLQKIGLTNLGALLVIGFACALVARHANSASGLGAVFFLGLGFLVAALSCFQMRLEARERLEKLEYDELTRARSSAALFSAETETFPAARARAQFERFLVPAFTVLLLLLQGGAAAWFWRVLARATPPIVARVTIALALFALFALVLFLLGKYSAGIARLEKQRLLRPGAGYLMLGALLCCVVTVTEAAAWFGFPRFDLWVARAFCVILALAALETALNLLLEIYRPRIKGQAARPLYESRLVDLLGQPDGVITTAAQALDYQFGFKVSETWFYRFLERAIAWLVLLQLGVLFLSTTFVIIEPGEQGLLERFGQPVAGRAALDAGFHLKWPWPVDKVYRYAAAKIRSFEVGFVHEEKPGKEEVALWTKKHTAEEFNLLVASREATRSATTTVEQAVPVNLLSVNIPVQYQVTNVFAWAGRHRDAARLLEDIANREVVRYLLSVDLEDVMTTGRLRAAQTIRDRIQTHADALGLGARVLLVGLQDIHPPVRVADAYEDVIGAVQEKAAKIHQAEGYRAETIPLAGAEAAKRLSEAKVYRVNKLAGAEARAAQFTNQLAAYKASPTVYSRRAYLDTLVRAVGPVRKYVLAVTNTQDIILLNLEDKIRTDLLDISLPDAKSK